MNITLVPLNLIQQSFPIGSTVHVGVSFTYTAGVASVLSLRAGPYYYPMVAGLRVGPAVMIESCIGAKDISLPIASSPIAVDEAVDFILVPKANGGMDDGTYGLRVWIEGENAEAGQDDVMVVTGNPSSSSNIMSQMMPMIMMLLMMGMVMPMMQGTNQDQGE
jgi:hypothetical protein